MSHKISIYSSLFQPISNEFDYKDALKNFCQFADEVVIATIKDEDNTFALLQEEVKNYPNLKIVMTDLVRYTPTFDGDLKNESLQACSNQLVLQLDCDERISIKSLPAIMKIGDELFSNPYLDAAFLPSINLYKDERHACSFGQKWYLHKKSGMRRGVVHFAKKSDGVHHNIHGEGVSSDSCELIRPDGNLAVTLPKEVICPDISYILNYSSPIIFHLGYLSVTRRKNININFWKKMWESESGENENIPITEEDIQKDRPYVEHKIPLWYE